VNSHPELILERVSNLAGELKLSNLQPQIAACRNQIGNGDRIDVAVFGRFKAGKSSFLNHLTGRSVLPIGVLPLTAVITRLRYGPVERAEVRFLDDGKREIPVGEIGRYVGENQNPNNEKHVASVEVEMPALKQFAPLQFVDTPGLGSAFAHNSQAALEWLPNVGAALVAVSSDAPLSQPDVELLTALRQHTPKIVVLLTKADLLTEAQRAEVLNFVKEQLVKTLKAELPVFFYSVRPEEDKLRVELDRGLLLPLVGNHNETSTEIARHKLLSLVERTMDYLNVALASATQAESCREALRSKLSEERNQFDLLRSELSVMSYEWAANALDASLSRLAKLHSALQEKATDQLTKEFERKKRRLPALLSLWRAWLREFLNRELSDLSHSQRAVFCDPLYKAQAHLTRTLRAFHDRLAEHVRSVFGLTLAPHEFSFEVREPAAPPVHVAFAYDAAFTTIGPLVPMFIFRAVIERQLQRKARYEVTKNVSRLAADWRDRAAKVITELTRDAEKQAMDELIALEQMLAQKALNAPALRKSVDELQQFQNRLRPN
jgi:GTP-binding protein EngB required for normal cell division